MKDRQIAPTNAEPRIFLVSAVLHCVSMTALVYLRSSFGFGYLRPKSVFFAFSWAFVLYAIYAWMEGSVWGDHRALILFGGGAVGLYWIHLFIAFAREWQENGEHEQHSGISHAVLLMRRLGSTPSVRFERKCRSWGEPGTVVILSIALGLIFGEFGLPRWLLVAAFCLWSKEALNNWFQIRGRKRRKDIFADTEETLEPPVHIAPSAEPSKPTRKAKVKRSRSMTAGVPEAARERQLAEVLRLMPPYTLQEAEANFRELIKQEHPDTNGDFEGSNARAAQLNEAIEYFRSRW